LSKSSQAQSGIKKLHISIVNNSGKERFLVKSKNEFVNKLPILTKSSLPIHFNSWHRHALRHFLEINVGLQKIPGYEISRTGLHEMDGKISPG
jgi:hypothetical protein